MSTDPRAQPVRELPELAVTETNGVASGDIRPLAPPRLPILRDAVFRRLLAVGDLVAAAGALVITGAVTARGIPSVTLASIPLIVLLAKLGGRYDQDEVLLRKSTLDETPQLLMLAAAFALVWAIVAFIADVHPRPSGAQLLALWGSTGTLLLALRAGARALAGRTAPAERVLIVGASKTCAVLTGLLASDPSARAQVVGSVPIEDEPTNGKDNGRQRTLDDLPSAVQEASADRVFVIPSGDFDLTADAVRSSVQTGVKVTIVPRLFEIIGSGVEFDTVGGITVLGLRRSGLTRSSNLVKRTVDIVGAALGMILLAPFVLLIAFLIKLSSPGPVLFRQTRVGKDGRPFEMLKFRTMFDGADVERPSLSALNETEGLFKLSDDPRVTRIGRFLRHTSLDEFPQLVNVLRGEMSLVGPRPLIMDEDALIQGRHRDRLNLTPGMTGLWQVLGPHRPPLSEMVKADYLYAINWSLWNDAKILLRTVSHVVGRRGR